VENHSKIRSNATLCRVLLRSFCTFVLSSLFVGTCGLHQSRSKTPPKNNRKLIYLNTAAFLEQYRGKDTVKPRLRYDTGRLVVTWRFWFNNADISRLILSRAEIKGVRFPLFCWPNCIQDKSRIFLTISIARIYSVFDMVTSQLYGQHKKNNVNKGLMSVPRRGALRAKAYLGPSWNLPTITVSEAAQRANFLAENAFPFRVKFRPLLASRATVALGIRVGPRDRTSDGLKIRPLPDSRVWSELGENCTLPDSRVDAASMKGGII
jgi:hypothetical protein